MSPAGPVTQQSAFQGAELCHDTTSSLQVFLSDLEVPIDTITSSGDCVLFRPGKKNWLFCWTEIGADRVAVIQSLLVTCKLQGVDPYTYLVDVLQRISEHPASQSSTLHHGF